MRQVTHQVSETFYAAGESIEDARARANRGAQAYTPSDAWEALGYFEKSDNPGAYEVFKFEVTEKVTQVDPPYGK